MRKVKKPTIQAPFYRRFNKDHKNKQKCPQIRIGFSIKKVAIYLSFIQNWSIFYGKWIRLNILNNH